MASDSPADIPVSAWSEDGALRELVRIARDLYDVDVDEAWRRLGRLTEEQRRMVSAAIDEVLGGRGERARPSEWLP